MADSGSSAHREPPSPTTQPDAKRRKIRKGTRSCWECKRRKNRCTWSGNEEKCDGCYHRGTRCISQEYPEENVSNEKCGASKSNNRLQRLEALVEELSRKVSSGNASGNDRQLPPDDNDEHHAATNTTPGPSAAVPSSKPSAVNDPADPYLHQVASITLGNGTMRMTSALLPSLAGPTDKSVGPLIRALVAAWPSRDHHDAILGSDAGPLHPALAAVCSGFRNPPSPKDLLQLPPPGATPVAIARKLLVLSTYLQVISSQSENRATGPGPEYQAISSRAFETVSRLITHNDNLPESVEIIECLIIESQHHNYMGKIRRAWISLRRAMAMAQMLGLDRQNKVPAQNMNADAVQVTTYQDNIWFLLVHFDQYLSLILGITPSLPENSQISPGRLERYTPSERMGRLHSREIVNSSDITVAAGRILQRNRVDIYDMVETKEIDKILQMASACMPAEWWLPQDGSNDCGGEGIYGVVNRLMVQFAHYNILLHVHLPYLLHCLDSQKYYRSTSTVVNSSREILTCFTAFRSRHPTVSYCRGLDIFAFVASITLCLLHIYTSHKTQGPDSCDGLGISTFLAHQRVTNRGLMERALRSIEKISQVERDDKVTSEIVPVFRKLLAVEEEAYKGVDYSIYLLSNTTLPRNNSGGVTDGSDTLFLEVPFCGTIKVERTDALDTTSTEISKPEGSAQSAHILMGSFPPSAIDYLVPLPALQGSEDRNAVVVERHPVDKHQSDAPNAPTIMPASSGFQPTPYDGNDVAQASTAASVPVAQDITGSFEEMLNPLTDAGFFERFWEAQ
ncbi:hypothetical protein F4859DRAFT_425384 [Xylaria cf. heliscus]|nr:hypothetical protein F4859DRAFT_425384 [Xylaria cf. heliscus]